MDLDQIKSSWNEVLDSLLDQNRVAWIAFFDARLVSFENNELTLDFSDSQKFVNPHDFKKNRNSDHTQSLISAIKSVLGITPTIIER